MEIYVKEAVSFIYSIHCYEQGSIMKKGLRTKMLVYACLISFDQCRTSSAMDDGNFIITQQ